MEPVQLHATLIDEKPSVFVERTGRRVTTRVYNVTHNLNIESLLEDGQQFEKDVTQAFTKMITPMLGDVKDDDLVSVRMSHPDFVHGDMFVTYRRWDKFKYSDVYETFLIVAQSNKTFLLNGKITMTVAVISKQKVQ